MSKWVTTRHCTVCEKKLTNTQVMYSDGCCPFCGNTEEGTVVATVKHTSQVSTAWTITKLRVVRALLRPLLRLHIWYVAGKKAPRETMQGPDARMEYLIEMAKKGRRP